MNKIFAFLLLITAVVLISCNPDVQFGTNDNVPKIAEKMLGMTPQEALSYMQKKGFAYEGDENHAQHPREFIFSKGAKNAQFSFDAPIVIWLNQDWNDTINSIEAEQRMDGQRKANNLYWKWSHYTESIFASETKEWYATITTNGSLDYLESDYDNREQFWADFKSKGDSLIKAYEYYMDMDLPKEINMGVTFENAGMYILYYDTRSYIDVPLPCAPSQIRQGHPCN